MLILSLLGVATCCLLGAGLLRRVPLSWHGAEYAAASVVAGLFLAGWLLLILVAAVGYVVGPILWLTYCIGVTLFLWITPATSNFSITRPLVPNGRLGRAWLAMTVGGGLLLAALFVTHMLPPGSTAYLSAGPTWADLALHLSLANRFAAQDAFAWDSPIVTGVKLTYPFLIDFISGMLLRFGANVQTALLVPSFLLVLSLVQLLFFATYRLTKSTLAALLAPVLFLANGGPIGLVAFLGDWLTSGLSLLSYLGSLPRDYSHIPEIGQHFTNILLTYVLPQRGVLLGIPLFLVITRLWAATWQDSGKSVRVLPIAAVLAGLLPFAHVHTFFVVWGVWVWLTMIHMWKQRTWRTPWLAGLVGATLIAAPQLIWQFSGNYGDGFSYLHWGWLKSDEQSIVLFWLLNAGAAGITALAGLWQLLRRHRDSFLTHWYVPLLILFVMTNVYVFQPNTYDNMKFMIYSYLAIVVVTAGLCGQWWRHVIGKVAVILIVFSMTASGWLGIMYETYTLYPFVTYEEHEVAKRLAALTPTTSRILTSDQHNHPVSTFSGRQIVMGYRGWLWTYGIDYQDLEQDVAAMFFGSPDTPQLLAHYDIDFVVIGPSERRDFQANETYYRAHYPVVLNQSSYVVFDVRAASRQ